MPSRIVHLPLSWDDPATQLAIQKYMQIVRKDAPWCPSNIEFIRRINGLDSIEEVKRIVFDASYLVLGLGDVYLGAPVATPVDPRHRLVTTKYNPARTWTPENCRRHRRRVPVRLRHGRPGRLSVRRPHLPDVEHVPPDRGFHRRQAVAVAILRPDAVLSRSAPRFARFREEFLQGRVKLEVTHETFSLRKYNGFLTRTAESIAAFKNHQQAAFDAERERWEAAGLSHFTSETADSNGDDATDAKLPPGSQPVFAEVPATSGRSRSSPANA